MNERLGEGLTMESLLPVLGARGANSVRVTSLLEKRTERSSGFKGHYVGFSVPDKFVVGYCLDFNEIFRCACALDGRLRMRSSNDFFVAVRT